VTHSDQSAALENDATLVWDEHKELDGHFRETWHELAGAGKGRLRNQPKPFHRSSTLINKYGGKLR
jgi:hypothetical protein